MSIKKQSEQQIYGRNDMVNIEPNKKIYGSLGKTEKWFLNTVEGNPVTMANSRKGSFEKEVTEFDLYGWSKQETTTGKNLCSIKSCQLSTNVVSSDVIPWTKSSQVYYAFDTQNISGAKAYISIKYHDADKKIVGSNGSNPICDGTRKTGWFSGLDAQTGGSDIDLTTIEYISVQLGLYNDTTTSSFIDNIIVSGDKNVSYEPYTGGKPSPSPEYPQEIASIGENGSIDIGITGKNLLGLFDFHKCYVSETNKFVSNSSSVSYSCETKKLPEKIILSGNNINRNNISYTNKKPEVGTLFDIVNVKENPITIKKEYEYINVQIAYGSVPDNVQIEKGTEATSYEPYKQPQSLSITTPTGLSAIPVPSGTSGITYIDTDGQAWIADEIDFSRGKYVQRVWKGVFDGSEDEVWTYNIGAHRARMILNNGNLGTYDKRDIASMCSNLLWNRNVYLDSNRENGYLINNNTFFVRVTESLALNTEPDFRTWLASNPITLQYVLATPIETDLSEAQIQAYKSLTTFKPTTIISNDAECHMKLTYKATGN